MYGGGYSSGPDLTNNPFINDPTNPQSRFPALESPSPDPSATPFTSWMQPGQSSFQSPQPSGIYAPQMQPQQQQQQQQGYASPISPQYTSQPFQPSSYFGQQLQAAATGSLGSSYGYLSGQNTPNSASQQYNPAQQQLQSPGYVAQFDPYSSIAQGWDGGLPQQQQQQQQPQQQQQTSAPIPTTSAGTYNGSVHPREYIRTHKQEIEAWDSYAWKQLLSSFDALRDAWGAKHDFLRARIEEFKLMVASDPQYRETALVWYEWMKQAASERDSVAASAFQIREVFETYRQSGDSASKRRVREAANAAIQGLPGFPDGP